MFQKLFFILKNIINLISLYMSHYKLTNDTMYEL